MFTSWQSLLLPSHHLLKINSELLGLTFTTRHDLPLARLSGLSLILSQSHTSLSLSEQSSLHHWPLHLKLLHPDSPVPSPCHLENTSHFPRFIFQVPPVGPRPTSLSPCFVPALWVTQWSPLIFLFDLHLFLPLCMYAV